VGIKIDRLAEMHKGEGPRPLCMTDVREINCEIAIILDGREWDGMEGVEIRVGEGLH